MNSEQYGDLVPMRDGAGHFDVVLRGFDRGQVGRALEQLEAEIHSIAAERDRALAGIEEQRRQTYHVQVEVQQLKQDLANAPTPSFESLGSRIAQMLTLANEESDELRAKARAVLDKADSRDTEAQVEADRIIAEATEKAATIVSTAERTAAEKTRVSEESRRQAEADFDTTLNLRRTEASRVIEEREQATKAEAVNRVETAKAEAAALLRKANADADRTRAQSRAEADRMIAGARTVVDQLLDVRKALVGQLGSARVLLDGVPDALGDEPKPPAGSEPGSYDHNSPTPSESRAAGTTTPRQQRPTPEPADGDSDTKPDAKPEKPAGGSGDARGRASVSAPPAMRPASATDATAPLPTIQSGTPPRGSHN